MIIRWGQKQMQMMRLQMEAAQKEAIELLENDQRLCPTSLAQRRGTGNGTPARARATRKK